MDWGLHPALLGKDFTSVCLASSSVGWDKARISFLGLLWALIEITCIRKSSRFWHKALSKDEFRRRHFLSSSPCKPGFSSEKFLILFLLGLSLEFPRLKILASLSQAQSTVPGTGGSSFCLLRLQPSSPATSFLQKASSHSPQHPSVGGLQHQQLTLGFSHEPPQLKPPLFGLSLPRPSRQSWHCDSWGSVLDHSPPHTHP